MADSDNTLKLLIQLGIIGQEDAKAAMAAFDSMHFTNPKRAVELACKYDNNSRKPVRLYRL